MFSQELGIWNKIRQMGFHRCRGSRVQILVLIIDLGEYGPGYIQKVAYWIVSVADTFLEA